MYKMKDVCYLTGLTEKTIRYYISQDLISPRIDRKGWIYLLAGIASMVAVWNLLLL